MSNLNIVVVGATGAVGVEFLDLLARRHFSFGSLRLLASAKSIGRKMKCGNRDFTVEALDENSFRGAHIAFFSAGGSISKKYAPIAAKCGCVVIDNSSAFRMDPNVPLVIPEINPEAALEHRGIIANPNCSTIIALVPLWPLHRHNRIRRIIAATYQAASGGGAAAMQELLDATKAYLEGGDHKPQVLPHPYAFNLFSHNAAVDPVSLYNEEELKMVRETKKIFNDPDIRISATCVRVPVLRAHCEALNVEFTSPISPSEVRNWLTDQPGVRLVDDPHRNYFPMPREASGQNDVLVGRIRQDMSDPSNRSIAMFVSGDQLLKGAALNGIQIAELLVKNGLGAAAA